MRTIKAVTIFLAACLLLLTVAGSAAAAPLSDADCQDIFIKANRQMLKMNSYHMTFDSTASLSMQGKSMAFVLAGEFDVQVKPMLMKNTFNMTLDLAGKKSDLALLQYTEEAGDKFMVYTKDNNRWVKQVMPKPYPYKNYDEFLKYYDDILKGTSVTLVRETDDALVLDATVTADSMRESIEKALAFQEGKNIKIPEILFNDLEDFKYTAVIDKKTLLISELSMDMTDFLRSVGQKILEFVQMPEDKKAPFREALDSVKVQFNIALSRFNSIAAVTIPKEARNAPLAVPGKPDKPDALPPAKTPSPTTAAGDATVKIGANLELTGSVSKYGQAALEGAQLAVDELNSSGGILGRRLELVARDNTSRPTEAANVAAALISQDKVVAIVGAVTSADTLPAVDLAEDYRIPLISPSATNPMVTVRNGQRKQYVFRAAFVDPFQGKALSLFAADSLHAKTAAIIVDNSSDYSKAIAQVFKSHFTANGGTIVAQQAYLQKDRDFAAQLLSIRDANPDIVLIPGYYQEVGLIIRQAREMGITAPLLGADGWDSPKIVEYAGAEALHNTFFSNHFALQGGSPLAEKFVAAYTKRYNKPPDTLSALGYESVLLLAAAIKKAGSAHPGKIRDALEDIEIEGITGRISFDAFHNPVKTAVVMTFENGRQTLFQRISPE